MYECRARIAGCELLCHETIHGGGVSRASDAGERVFQL